MSKPSPARYRTMNWSSYNASLRKRGSLLIWVDREMTWLAPRDGRPGRPPIFSDAAVQFCLSIKVLFKLPLRQTAGMVASLLRMAGLDWPVPDFFTLCRRQKTLAVQIPYSRADGPLNLLVDSTGIKFLGDGEWQARKHGVQARRQWRKVHLAMDPATSDIRAVEFKAPRFPATKSLDSFDFKAIPKLNKMQVLELARCEWIERRENVIALGSSGTGKTHISLGLGLAACQKGMAVSFTTAAALVNELMEARDERRLLRLQKQLAGVKLLIIDELGFVPLSKTGAELLFELISRRYERGATLITSNLPFDEWTETFGTERLTGALLDRLTHHVNILEMNGDSYRLGQSRARKAEAAT